jgi:hypothetical protein
MRTELIFFINYVRAECRGRFVSEGCIRFFSSYVRGFELTSRNVKVNSCNSLCFVDLSGQLMFINSCFDYIFHVPL